MARRGHEALIATPALDLRMVTRQQRSRHAAALPLLRPGVVRAVQQAIQGRVEAIELVTALVVQHTRLDSRQAANALITTIAYAE